MHLHARDECHEVPTFQKSMVQQAFHLSTKILEDLEQLERFFSFQLHDGPERVVSFPLPDSQKEVRIRMRVHEVSALEIITRIFVGGDSVDHQLLIVLKRIRTHRGILKKPEVVYLSTDPDNMRLSFQEHEDMSTFDDVTMNFCQRMLKSFQLVVDSFEEALDLYREAVRNKMVHENRFEVSEIVKLTNKTGRFSLFSQKNQFSKKMEWLFPSQPKPLQLRSSQISSDSF